MEIKTGDEEGVRYTPLYAVIAVAIGVILLCIGVLIGYHVAPYQVEIWRYLPAENTVYVWSWRLLRHMIWRC